MPVRLEVLARATILAVRQPSSNWLSETGRGIYTKDPRQGEALAGILSTSPFPCRGCLAAPGSRLNLPWLLPNWLTVRLRARVPYLSATPLTSCPLLHLG